ncbi:deoxyribodipyrimidine photo-lyase, 8-HDF type [Thermosynechococcus vestitus]|uniref:DNA photolyase n=1 Tax=Thermosynechococcus vestitus (strain NIES-2133 / IAM M-273 / BP-1) TaxID=197221 RepID=Q8DLQ3_THEVB|nr:deoxyribodipyrimidine photo-lyase, 8-HDF type [Thermosynechococcus vestitus]BAC07977.1 DNA photolyase [Thermosynechococcus vestitus BP-1]
MSLRLFWHRRDLRLNDNLGLAAAYTRTPKVVGLFCFDPAILSASDIAAVRVAYLVGCLQALQEAYRRLGGSFLIFRGDPRQILPQVAKGLGAVAVHWHEDVEPYGRERDRAVAAALKEKGIAVETAWDQLLHPPEAIQTKQGQPYTVYSPFWRNWSSLAKPEPVSAPRHLEPLTEIEQATAGTLGAICLPTAKDLGFHWSGDLILAPGEAAAQAQLETFIDQHIQDYGEQRNYPAQPGTSLLSPALKFGVIGIRRVWTATQAAMAAARSEEAQRSIRTWQQELAWREFYQHALYWFPHLAERPHREGFATFPWLNNEAHFAAWCEGRTGYPIVDAAMRQLNETGWMHNRCRMIVASFLTKDLIINPQWGERYFMQKLIDGDLAANNGGWQWSASSGMDPKPLRIFNPASQAQKFDPEAEYIRRWLPEVRSLDTIDLVTGNISPLERHRCGYPLPIVDHRQQQQRFKQLYQEHFRSPIPQE